MSEISSETATEKSFDVLASVRLYRYDLQDIGYIRPETRQRVFEEELSYIAEGINRPNFTEFVLHEEKGELVYFHEGRWCPYISTLIKGLNTAKAEAANDPRKQFEVDRRAGDLKRGYQLQKLRPGEKLGWYYEFPWQQMALYGEKFIGDMGFFPERAMGYLCEAEKMADGRLILRHQSVDNSDKNGFVAAMTAAENGADIGMMTAAYDQVLSQKRGGEHHAGRRRDCLISEENAWSAILKYQELVAYLMDQVEAIARLNLSDEETEIAKKRLTYGVWARLKEKIDEDSLGINVPEYDYSDGVSIQTQIETAYESAAARGETLFGCGGSITGEKAILQASGKDVLDMIFGLGEKKWFGCPYCGAKQYGDPCARHLYCPDCTAEVKNGKVVSKGNGGKGKKIGGFIEIFMQELNEWNRRYNLEQEQKKLKQKTEQLR